MLPHIKLENVLFLDIETVPQHPDFSKAAEPMRQLWSKKCQTFKTDLTPEEQYHRAGIYAEFGRIICISVGFTAITAGKRSFRIKTFHDEDERALLTAFINLLEKHFNKKSHILCAHNGKEFDFPYLARRIIINGLKLPTILNIAGKKPWEIPHVDTMELWKFGDYKSYTSLSLLAEVFGINTPKDDIDGSQVYKVYYEEKNIQRIVAYCQKDVLTVAQVLLKFKGEPLIAEDSVVIS